MIRTVKKRKKYSEGRGAGHWEGDLLFDPYIRMESQLQNEEMEVTGTGLASRHALQLKAGPFSSLGLFPHL